MTSSEQKLRQILEQLYLQLDHGWQAFLAYRYASTALEEGLITDLFYIVKSIELSCLDSVYLALSKLLIDNKDSITIWYLLNYIDSDPKILTGTQPEQIKASTDQHRQQLVALQTTTMKIEERRDRTIAHLDRKHVNDPSTVYVNDSLNELEVQNAFKLALEILNSYAGYLGLQQPFSLDAHSAGLAEDWYKLVTLINPATKASEHKARAG